MKADEDKYSKPTIVHLKHVFYGKYTCIFMPSGVVGCHGVISSTGQWVLDLYVSKNQDYNDTRSLRIV